MKALGVFIFGGSATFGAEAAGYKVDRVLEMVDEMKELNSYHFVKNRPDIPIILPNEWENAEYLESLSKESYDLIYANCPCSSLSQINKNASIDGDKNVHFYRVFKVIETVKPKAFFIENAPTLVKLGYPILQDMVKKLGNDYKFTIIRDYGGNHGIAMKRMRTLVIGWRKDVFENKIPLLHMNHMKQLKTKDVIGNLYNHQVGDPSINNHTLIFDDMWTPVEHLFKDIPEDTSSLMEFIDNWDKYDSLIEEGKVRDEVLNQKAKLEKGQRLWDKSPFRPGENSTCPSMTSVTLIVHPIHSRTFTIREYARLMGYPDDFVFYPEECQTPIIQTIAQGVPKPLVQYITTEIKEALLGNRQIIENSEDKVLCFQHQTHKVWKAYTQEDIDTLTELEHVTKDKTFEKLTQ